MRFKKWLPMAALAAATGGAAAADCCNVVELRQYINFPGMRDTLSDLFEQRFIEPQEAAGISVVATFRDLNEPNHFTWVRGFSGMEARKKALTDFYYGPLWQEHRSAANATLYDNDNVLLLRPASPGSGFAFNPAGRPAYGSRPAGSFVTANIYYFGQEVTPQFVDHFNRQLMPLFEQYGARIVARLVSEKSRNTFEQLPVREGVDAFVWFARFDDRAAYERFQHALGQDQRWRSELFSALYKSLSRPPEVLMLTPTGRSLLK